MYRNFSEDEQTVEQMHEEKLELQQKRDLLLLKRLQETFTKFKIASNTAM